LSVRGRKGVGKKQLRRAFIKRAFGISSTSDARRIYFSPEKKYRDQLWLLKYVNIYSLIVDKAR
jgi:hypothetical protein